MLKKATLLFVASTFMIPALPSIAFAQLSPAAEWATHASNEYQVIANVTYMTATGYESKLDVYKRRDATTPQPTLVFYHGGGWIAGTKEASVMSIVPWLEMGWNVVNVEYRMARVALAPAAVEDASCALRFVVDKAKDYGIDTNRIVVSGESAGGHLALAVGMIPASAGFTRACAGGGFRGNDTSVPKVAAIINWYGVTDVAEMLGGANARSYAVQWLGTLPNRDEVARSVSPHLCSCRPPPDPEHSGRRRSDRALFSERAAARGVDQNWCEQRAVPDSRRRPRQLQAGRADQGVCQDSRVPRQERPDDARGDAVEPLTRRRARRRARESGSAHLSRSTIDRGLVSR
jgi:acetyl esterase/lipase